jgi:ParB-like chromosome segregation protein Spo0J
METLHAHPVAQLFPLLPEDELAALAEDIKMHGLQEPITTYNGMILDGRNRYAACQRAGVEPTTVEWTGDGSPIAWVIGKNLLRRHLDASQRAVIAVELKDLLSAEAKQRQRATLKRGEEQPVPTELQGRGESAEEAAKLVGVSPTYVYQAQRVKRESPEQWEQVLKGDMSVSAAYSAVEWEAGREAREAEDRKYWEREQKREDRADRRFQQQVQALTPADGDLLSLAQAKELAQNLRIMHTWASSTGRGSHRAVARSLKKLLKPDELKDLPGMCFELGHFIALVGKELGYTPDPPDEDA